ncbi:FAD-binding oxidoreductase [Bradyrhizobium sp. LHD-71]|uniref:NAD(P)/FAD-dependent oxidoreductase n=1 Tax=Bradyrhizobium sp. LHD-71 TaxID=3072141 RepID=UPI0028107DED|nr:FAD-binding oxidoreductase [Bradyrhizobium sp. LHD-71]MDQ8728313.1 FAD-binding oxidoreductase [Bradyrhizobium sp. LHD-71]
MGLIQRRVTNDTSAPPSLYGAAGVEPTVPAAKGWDNRVDVAIVGGGITGLWTAYNLATNGASVAVLESHEVGHGASGRAFGQLVPYLKHSHEKIIADLGEERGTRLSAAVAVAPAEVAAFIERYQIACAATRTGILIGARTKAGSAQLEATAAALRGAPAKMFYGSAAADLVGSDFYPAVLLDPRGFHLDPLAYARGLARAAAAHGALIHPVTRVDRIAPRGSEWDIICGTRQLTAEKVIIATNAYSGPLWPDLARSVVPFLVHGAVTEPLPEGVLADILPQGQPLTDTRRLYSGVRKFGGRLHVSIDGASFVPGRADAARMVQRRLRELYPRLPAPHVENSWSGWIALTTDQYPHIHRLAEGVWSAVGCNGRGLAAASLLGRDLAALARGAGDNATVFPVRPLRPLPLHDAAALVVATVVSTKRWLDRIDATTR